MNMAESNHTPAVLGIPTWTQNPHQSSNNTLTGFSLQVPTRENFSLAVGANYDRLFSGLIFRGHAQAHTEAAAVLVDELDAGDFERLAQGGFVCLTNAGTTSIYFFRVSRFIFHLAASAVA